MPKIKHASKFKKEEYKLLCRLMDVFADRAKKRIPKMLPTLEYWRLEENLLDCRKKLLALTRQAVLERMDSAYLAETTGKVDRNIDPYLDIAILAAICSFHVDDQLKRIESILGY